MKSASFILVVAILALNAGCDSKGTKSKVSASVFFAPVPLAVNDSTGTNERGERRVEVAVSKVDFLRKVDPAALREQLEEEDAETVVLGKLGDSVYVIFDRKGGSIFEYNVQTDDLRLSVTRADLEGEFRTPNPRLSALTDLRGGSWIYGFESTSRSLFLIYRDFDPGAGIEKARVVQLSSRGALRTQLHGLDRFTFQTSFELGNRTEVNNDGETVQISEVLLVASPPGGAGGLDGIHDIHLYVVTQVGDGTPTGALRPFDSTGTPFFGQNNGDIGNPKPIIPDPSQVPQFEDILGLVNYDAIRRLVGIASIDIFGFKPVALRDPAFPKQALDTPRFFLLYEQVTSSFIIVEVMRENRPDYPAFGEIIGSRLTLFSNAGEVVSAIQQGGIAGGVVVEAEFDGAFFHPEEPTMLAFEEVTNTMMAVDYSGVDDSFELGVDPEFGTRVEIFSSNANLLNRRDVQLVLDADQIPQEASFAISTADARNNRMIFDRGTDDILALNYKTALYVVVIKQFDIGRATESVGASNITYIDPITEDSFLVMDTQTSNLVKVRVEYAGFPVKFRQ